jgi:hypothetical protein
MIEAKIEWQNVTGTARNTKGAEKNRFKTDNGDEIEWFCY